VRFRVCRVPVLLHLTDLHLDTPDDHSGADFKNDIVPLKERPDRLSALRSTLRAIGESDWNLDAVVITGDIPYRNSHDSKGWDQFDTALQPLTDANKMPAADRIIVTPGNHDVEWGVPIGDPEHYAKFLEHVRGAKYTTPLLDGIDFNDDGQITSKETHYFLDLDMRLAIVPINTSHYCGALEPMGSLTDAEWEAVLQEVDAADNELAKKLEKQVVDLRSQDIARISEPHFIALTALVGDVRAKAMDEGVDPSDLVWIAAVHHHLLPVNTDEEFKSYESMTNLGRFRQLLVTLGFDAVLHGHKHAGGVYWDRVHRVGSSLRNADPRLLVVSGSTAGARREGTQEMGRLVEVLPTRLKRAIVVSKVPVIDHGGQLPDRLSRERADLWESEMLLEAALPRLVTGSDPSSTYARVRALFAGLPPGQAISDLICEIRSPDGADQPPEGYPVDRVPGGPEEVSKWFEETVRWWQQKGSKFQFTHGQRLRAWGSDRINQIDRSVQLLQDNASSTRAVITLFDPSVDDVPVQRIAFPSFSFAHLMIRATEAEPPRLDCLGFFRKQEMRFWWPINVAELALLQAEVHDRLDQPDLHVGSIITYASLAHVGDEVPDVNITAVDRLADDGEDRLWNMAYGVVHPESVDAERVKEDWLDVLTDLEPVEDDQVPRPRLGIRLLQENIERFGPHEPDSPAGEVAQRLSVLENAYDAIAKKAGTLDHWRDEIQRALQELRERIEGRLSV
jgi:Calcineurin-like phosphoesterase